MYFFNIFLLNMFIKKLSSLTFCPSQFLENLRGTRPKISVQPDNETTRCEEQVFRWEKQEAILHENIQFHGFP